VSPVAPDLVVASDLGRALDLEAECLAVLPLKSNLFQISFQAPELARRARPGEFAQIWVDQGRLPLLRRPFSLSRAEPDLGVIAFYVGAVGEGSRHLQRFRPGDRARILGPLGRGFTLPARRGRSILVSGGLGAAPLPLLADRLRERGEELIWLNGARTRAELYPDRLLPGGLAEVVRFTEDGSAGEPGLVTAGLGPRLAGAQRVYACGPNPMLAATFRLLQELAPRTGRALPLEVSIEAPMGCGFGSCLGCVIPLRREPGAAGSELGLCCRQGPVLRAELLDWERLLQQPAHLE